MEPVNERLPVIVVNSAIEYVCSSLLYLCCPWKLFNNESPMFYARVYIHAKSAAEGQQTERYWKLMNDVALRFLVKEVKESISLLNGEQERYVALAR